MVTVVQVVDRMGAFVASGVTSVAPVWEDGGAGTPTVSVAVVNGGTYGQWRVTVADVTPPRTAIVILSYDDGLGGTALVQVRVEGAAVNANLVSVNGNTKAADGLENFGVSYEDDAWGGLIAVVVPAIASQITSDHGAGSYTTVTIGGFAAGSITDAAFATSSQARKSLAFMAGKSVWNPETNTTTYYAADGSTVVFTDTRSVTEAGVITREVT